MFNAAMLAAAPTVTSLGKVTGLLDPGAAAPNAGVLVFNAAKVVSVAAPVGSGNADAETDTVWSEAITTGELFADVFCPNVGIRDKRLVQFCNALLNNEIKLNVPVSLVAAASACAPKSTSKLVIDVLDIATALALNCVSVSGCANPLLTLIGVALS